MRRLWSFSLFCVGVTSLLACWLTVFVVLAGLFLRAFGLWLFLGIPLALGLLLLGGWLMLPFMDEVEPDGDSILGAVAGSLFVAVAAMTVAVATADLSGAQIYHVRFGEETTAIVSWTNPVRNEYGNVTETWYYVTDYATKKDLGVLALAPSDGTTKGERIEVSVDPRGWMPPVPVERLGWTTVPTIVLVCCFAAMALAALTIIATALGAWMTRHRRTSGP